MMSAERYHNVPTPSEGADFQFVFITIQDLKFYNYSFCVVKILALLLDVCYKH